MKVSSNLNYSVTKSELLKSSKEKKNQKEAQGKANPFLYLFTLK